MWGDVWEWEDGGVQNHTEYRNSQQDTIKHRSQVGACVCVCVCEGCGVCFSSMTGYCSMVANVSEI